MKVEVAYLGEQSQFMIELHVDNGCTMKDAILFSNILNDCDELPKDWKILKNRVGIFGQLKPLETILQDNDRIEIYKDLVIDPKAARRKRAKSAQKTTANGKRGYF